MLKDADNKNIKPVAPIGEFFSDKKQGKNFTLKNPKLFKNGILKRCRADMKLGNKPFNVILANLGGAFNLHSVMQYYRPNDTMIWQKGIDAKKEKEKALDNTKMVSKYGKTSENDAMKKMQQPGANKQEPLKPKDKDLSKEGLIKNLTLEERASKYDMTIDAIKDI